MRESSLFRDSLLFGFLLVGILILIPITMAEGPLSGIKVCLDPGHGGSDPGAVNDDYGLHESDINLDVSYGLKSLLEGAGADVVMTRFDNSPKTNSDRYTFCNEEDATIVVSVHTNSVADPEWDGAMVLYAPSRDPDLAQAIFDKMYRFLLDTAPFPDEDKEAEFDNFGVDRFASGVLFKCDTPDAAMMEPLYMSHPAEAALLVKSIYDDPIPADLEVLSLDCQDFSCRRGQIAQAIYLGVLNFYDDEPSASMHVSNIDMRYKQTGSKFSVYTQVVVEDETDFPVPNAEVMLKVTLPDDSNATYSGLTGDDGSVTFKLRSPLTGDYGSEVIDISKAGWTYNPEANNETNEVLQVP